jgi:hypothetical protein
MEDGSQTRFLAEQWINVRLGKATQRQFQQPVSRVFLNEGRITSEANSDIGSFPKGALCASMQGRMKIFPILEDMIR